MTSRKCQFVVGGILGIDWWTVEAWVHDNAAQANVSVDRVAWPSGKCLIATCKCPNDVTHFLHAAKGNALRVDGQRVWVGRNLSLEDRGKLHVTHVCRVILESILTVCVL